MKDKYAVTTVTMTRGPLIARLEVSTYVATSHNTALPGHHNADNDFPASWQGSETYIKLFYEFERRKELVVVL
jgi:hypothetical protein